LRRDGGFQYAVGKERIFPGSVIKDRFRKHDRAVDPTTASAFVPVVFAASPVCGKTVEADKTISAASARRND